MDSAAQSFHATQTLRQQTRIRVRLPGGILQLYKGLADEMPIRAARRGLRRQGLIEMALLDAVYRWSGEAVATPGHAMRSYSLVLGTSLLEQVQQAARERNVKCAVFISDALVDFLAKRDPDRYARLKQTADARPVRGARVGAWMP